jgi:hypothetical protein
VGDAELACGVGEWLVGAPKQGHLVLSGLAGKQLPDSDYAAESLPPVRFKLPKQPLSYNQWTFQPH